MKGFFTKLMGTIGNFTKNFLTNIVSGFFSLIKVIIILIVVIICILLFQSGILLLH